jgi:7,8-didemethyl-8-hydroxy-5-deazariboflavin synthase CofG subunit
VTAVSGALALSNTDIERFLVDALAEKELDRGELCLLAEQLGDPALRSRLFEVASELKQRGKGDVVTVSRNVFIPLTNLCRNRCGYCTFAKQPGSPEAKTYALEEVASTVCSAQKAGCLEALFCLGDKPERAYKEHRAWLAERGFASTAEYLIEACEVTFRAGMFPHSNAGILTRSEMEALRPWNASMGLMLETSSTRLRGKGMPHYYAPDKEPSVRLRMHEEAGELKIPFTSGLLLGIGETNEERVDTLFALRDIEDRYGHLQEVIVQPFHPKFDTPMAESAPLTEEIFAGWVALARLVLGSRMNLQAPPNLSPTVLPMLLAAGVNDWGGVSPVSLDYINPEAPWPALLELKRQTEASGQELRERLPVYPEWITHRPEYFEPQMLEALKARADREGYVRAHTVESDPHPQQGRKGEAAA